MQLIQQPLKIYMSILAYILMVTNKIKGDRKKNNDPLTCLLN